MTARKSSRTQLNLPTSINQRKPCTHLAGEFFVAAELSRMGFNVALTMGNAKRVDLVVENDDKTLPIQVKALAHRKNVGWPINPESNFGDGLVFVMVVLGAKGGTPEYYIVSGSVIQRKRKRYKGRAIVNIKDVSEFRDNWTLIENRLR
jgi:hypothetical protein